MLFSQIMSSILNISWPFESQIVSFFLWIDTIGYKLFALFYKAFLKLAQQELFELDAFDTVYKNLYLIVGVVALFLIAFMLLKMMVNPEADKGGKQIKDMITRLILSVFLTCLLPSFFGFLRDAQNILLMYNVVPRVLLDTRIAIQQVDEDGNNIGEQTFLDENDVNITTSIMEYRANEMVVSIISGLMYPLAVDNDSYGEEPAMKVYDATNGFYRYYKYYYSPTNNEEWHTNVSDWWDGNAKGWVAGVSCILGAGALVIFTVATYGASSGLTIGLAPTLLACAGGAFGITSVVGGVATVTASEYTWTNALQAITNQGNFSQISLFAGAIAGGTFHYTVILSTIVVGILVYMMISFCIDVVIRQAKMVYYQLLAPICFMLSIIPSKKDLLSNWFKLVFTLWVELFIRIFCLCGVVLLISKLDLTKITSIFHPIISTFIVLGLVIFAKQIPKLLGDVIGFDTSNMKLGLKDKLGDAGLFTAGAIVGGGVTALTRNAVNSIGNTKDKWKDTKGFMGKAGLIGGSIASTLGGGLSGAFRAGKSGWNARSWGDMSSAAGKGAASVVEARKKREAYKADHGGAIFTATKDASGKLKFGGTLLGHYEDALEGAKKWIGLEADYSSLQSEQSSADSFMSSIKKIGDISEDFILKHQSEFFALTDEQKAKIEELLQKAQTAKSEADRRIFEQQAEAIRNSARLDILEALIKEAERRGDATAIAEATKRYKSAFKSVKDEFASAVFTHPGASKEAIAIQAEIDSINHKLAENVTSQVVSLLREGRVDPRDAAKPIVSAQTGEVTADNAAKFLKELKSAAEVTSAEISAERSRLERKQKKDN